MGALGRPTKSPGIGFRPAKSGLFSDLTNARDESNTTATAILEKQLVTLRKQHARISTLPRYRSMTT
jgi:hypothetical protein